MATQDELVKDMAEVKTSLVYIQKSIDQLTEISKHQNKMNERYNFLAKEMNNLKTRIEINEVEIKVLSNWKIAIVS